MGKGLVQGALLRCWDQLLNLSTRSLVLTLSLKLPLHLRLLFWVRGGA